MIRAASYLTVLLVMASPLSADGFRVRTTVSVDGAWSGPASLDSALGFGNRRSYSGGARLMWQQSFGAFRLTAHSNVSLHQGDSVPYGAAIATATPPRTLFNLTSTLYSGTTRLGVHTIDRLSVGYSTDNTVLKVGRQAVTWGAGTVFHPSDIVAAFSPGATDTSYKAGADMVYGQVLFANGADVQAIAVPRALTIGGPVSFDASTMALRAQYSVGSLDGSLMIAKDRGDDVVALGLSGALGGASWNAEVVNWSLNAGGTYPSWLFNISNFGTLGQANIAYFAEYAHNGFGVDATVALDSLPARLTKRMAAGQVFLPGRDFLALGAQIQLSPDLSLGPSVILSLKDRSARAGLAMRYTLNDNATVIFNAARSFGALGTEFGGRETSTGSGVYGTPAQTTSLQLVRFF